MGLLPRARTLRGMLAASGSNVVLCVTQGSRLPALQQSRLNAPRVLPIHKVVSYIMAKLRDQGIVLETVPVYWRKELMESLPFPEDSTAPFLEVICNGMVRLHCWQSLSPRPCLVTSKVLGEIGL